MNTNADPMSQALQAVHDEALRLLLVNGGTNHEIEKGLHLIASIARHRMDVRSQQEIDLTNSQV